MCQNLCRGVTNFVDRRTESEYSFGKLLTSAHSLSAKCFGIEENMYNLSKEESDRIRIINFIAIILVVYFHSYTTGVYFSDGTNTLYLPGWLQVIEKGVSQVIAGCNVQIFFLLSAILLFRSEQRYGTVLKKKIRTLLLPYLIWNTFWVAVFVALQSLPFTTVYFSGNNTPILQSSAKEWLGLYGIGRNFPQCYPLWFIRDLIVIILIFPVIKAVVNRFPRIMLCIGILLTIFPFSFYCKTALAWSLMGAAIVKMQIHMAVLDKISMTKISAAYLVGALAAYFLDIGAVRSIFTLTGVLFWVRISREIYVRGSIRKSFLWMSQWTFMIYVLHEMTLTSIRKVCLRLFPTSPINLLLEYLLIPISVITGCIITGIILKKCMPGLYLFVTGERSAYR